jgi:branched-chain amino acid transport system ATP-binding protein
VFSAPNAIGGLGTRIMDDVLGVGEWDVLVGGLILLVIIVVHQDGIAEYVTHALRPLFRRLRLVARVREEAPLQVLPPEPVPPAALTVANLTVRFGGVVAVDDVSFDVQPGEVVGLIGPNGAGKTTFFNCLLGLLRPDGGTVRFEGQDLSRVPTPRRARLGIGRTFQRVELFSGLSPRQHFLVAERVRNGRGALWKDVLGLGRPNGEEREKAQAMLELLGLEAVADRAVESLSLGVGRLVEVGRALMTEPKLLLLDEPSSGHDRAETAELEQTLLAVHRERNLAILLVEHDVELVRSFVRRVYVLDFGTLIASGPTETVFADDAFRKAYLGDLV